MADPLSSAALDRITALAADALTSIVSSFRKEYPDERMYSFGPYIPDDVGYASIALFTEAGLAKVADRYQADSGGNRANHVASLRWSPADSPFHCYQDSEISDVSDLLGNHRDADEATHVETDHYSFDDHWEQRVKARQVTLQKAVALAETRGVFDSFRDQVTLCVWGGDQSNEDRFWHAQTLNPTHVYDQFIESYTDDFQYGSYARPLTPERIGRLEEAEQQNIENLPRLEQIFGVHSAVAEIFGTISNIQEQLGRLTDAEQNMTRTAEIFETLYGPEHVETTRALEHLARIRSAAG